MKYKDVNPFYNRVDSMIRNKGMSHKELAESIGVEAVTLHRHLALKRSCSLSAFMGICEVIGVSAEDLFRTYTYARLAKRVDDYRRANSEV